MRGDKDVSEVCRGLGHNSLLKLLVARNVLLQLRYMHVPNWERGYQGRLVNDYEIHYLVRLGIGLDRTMA